MITMWLITVIIALFSSGEDIISPLTMQFTHRLLVKDNGRPGPHVETKSAGLHYVHLMS